mmetsp:Transcript_52712/g.163567  ORF Transcript_52712/g.163567 Transcript_52712/m.163567 type:complete len:306 (+) Transcript_52712:1609-2526(+)
MDVALFRVSPSLGVPASSDARPHAIPVGRQVLHHALHVPHLDRLHHWHEVGDVADVLVGDRVQLDASHEVHPVAVGLQPSLMLRHQLVGSRSDVVDRDRVPRLDRVQRPLARLQRLLCQLRLRGHSHQVPSSLDALEARKMEVGVVGQSLSLSHDGEETAVEHLLKDLQRHALVQGVGPVVTAVGHLSLGPVSQLFLERTHQHAPQAARRLLLGPCRGVGERHLAIRHHTPAIRSRSSDVGDSTRVGVGDLEEEVLSWGGGQGDAGRLSSRLLARRDGTEVLKGEHVHDLGVEVTGDRDLYVVSG